MGGKPSQGTPKDMRLSSNKGTQAKGQTPKGMGPKSTGGKGK